MSEAAIKELVDRETRAWETQDVDLLLSVFHRDMVWPWPPSSDTHDPAEWVWGMGRFDEERWRTHWSELFATHELVHNDRRTVRIALSDEGDGAFAVVDVDTLWRHRGSGQEMRWRGRACKVYSLVGGEWKLTMHTGLLDYSDAARHPRATVEAYAAALSDRDVEGLAVLVAPDVVGHEPTAEIAGFEAFTANIEDWLSTYSNLTIETEDLFEQGDRAAWRWRLAGIHKDTDRAATVTGTIIFRVENGRIAEYWGHYFRHDG